MITTFQQIWSEVQSGTQNQSASELVLIKRDANVATQRFKSAMSRPWSRISKKTSTVANQQDYQLPRSVLRVSGVDYLYGGAYVPLIEISSEAAWNQLNALVSAGIGIPRFFFPKGKDVISIYPVPGDATSEGLKVYYEPKQPRMVADDFSTGTVTVTNGNTTITHSAAGFLPEMVGRYFYVTDGTDGNDYQVIEYTDTSNLVIENFYEGISGSGRTFVIGATPDIPDEYQPSVVDYCMARFYLRRGDKKAAQEMMASFLTALDECKEVYASPTSYPNIQSVYDMSFNVLNAPPTMLG